MGKKSYTQAPVSKGADIEMEIKDLAYGGDSVGDFRGMTVFMPYGVPGQRVKARIVEVKRNFASARLLKVLRESAIYKKPECPYFGVCGGCDWMNIKQDKHGEFKQKFIKRMLEKISGLDNVAVNPVLEYEDPFHYRNRAQYKVAREGARIITGFYKARSHDVAQVDKCLIVAPVINEAAAAIHEALNERQKEVEVYSEIRRRGYLRHIAIRANRQGQYLVTFVVSDREIKPFVREIAEMLKEKVPGLAGAVININRDEGNAVFGESERVVWGSAHITENAGGIGFKLDSSAFFQVNASMLEKMADFVCRNIPENSVVLDLYGGVGALTLPYHAKYARIYSVESDKKAVERLKETARLNDIGNVEAINEPAESAGPLLMREKRIDAVVVDPPRKGLHPGLLPALKKSGIKRIIYISCNPSTFARDIKELKEDYFLREVTPLDQFSQTYHVEVMSLLELKKS
ncbi:MAG TPA: 23S rRNA (uracil(1939)-C(5))-methyltransferase RlmD [Candidatus Goldiibacteriota bacterium]|nr:23S rRNA (uracil(1939)-C(5))-methyltransferase RlmD [Candidatus Goldiibacteriota bacterium]